MLGQLDADGIVLRDVDRGLDRLPRPIAERARVLVVLGRRRTGSRVVALARGRVRRAHADRVATGVSESAPTPPSFARVLASTAFATTAGVLPTFLLGSQAVQVQRDLDFGPALLGVAVALSWAAAALTSPTMGKAAERIGGGRALRTAAFLNGGVMLLIAVAARNWWELAVLITVAGVGNALTQPAANVLMARTIAPERYGIAFAVKQSAMPFGTLIGGLAVPLVTLTLGWRWAFAFGGAMALVAAVTIPRHDASRPVPAASEQPDTARRSRPTLDTPMLLLAVLASGVGLGAATASAQTTFLVSGAVHSGLAEGVAGLLLMIGSALGIASRLLNGARADVRGRGHLRVVALMLLGGAVACAMFALDQPWSYVVATPLAFAAGLGVARAVQPGGRARQPAVPGIRHVGHPDRHLRRRRARTAALRGVGRARVVHRAWLATAACCRAGRRRGDHRPVAPACPRPVHRPPADRPAARPTADGSDDATAWPSQYWSLQEALVELAGGMAGQLVEEVDAARALHVGQVLAAVGDELALELGTGVGHVDRLHDRLHLFAEVLVRHADARRRRAPSGASTGCSRPPAGRCSPRPR